MLIPFYTKVSQGLQAIFDMCHDSLGTQEVVQSVQDQSNTTQLIVKMKAGYEIRIVCTEITYAIRYSRGFGVFDNHRKVFQVHCACRQGAPESIKALLEKSFPVPDMTMRFTSIQHKRRRAIMTFLQLVSADLHVYLAAHPSK